MALHNHKNCDVYVKMIENYFKTATGQDPIHKWINYVDSAKVNHLLGNMETAIDYMDKSIRFIAAQKGDNTKRIICTQRMLSLYDYLYYDPVELSKKYADLNKLISHGIRPMHPMHSIKLKPKIGYVSSDFTYHSVVNFILPILQHHTFDVVLFSNAIRVHPIFKSFNMVSIQPLTDKEAAQTIRDNDIDILIDLNGLTDQNRLGIFPYKPARIQMTYLGYPNTTGLTSIQYRITDHIADPIDSKQLYSETLLRMPQCFLLYKSIYQPDQTAATIKPRKTNPKMIVLGSINKEPKNTKQTLKAWATILRENPRTKLLIKLEAYDNYDSRLAYYMKHLKVEKTRLLLMVRTTDVQYNQLFSMVDIVLDTFPYAGTTTTCNALHNSIPVVTLTNKDYHAHNVSASLLKNAGLSELVTSNEDDYVKCVGDLINDVDRLNRYKTTIHGQFTESMQPAPFMKAYEALLQSAYKNPTLYL